MTALVIADRVKETSTSTGTGDFTVSGAVAGHVTLASKCSTGDTLYYCIQAVNAQNVPTGDWEVGLGTYSAANTLTRTTVQASSNAGAAVNFSAGGKQVSLVMPAAQVKWAKERLTADRSYYVRTDGSNSNSGLANTSGGAFLTIQYAIDFVSANINASGYIITINVADGTYNENIVMKKVDGADVLRVVGASNTATIISPSTSFSTAFYSTTRGNTCVLALRTMKIVTSSGYSIRADLGCAISTNNINFGASGYHISAWNGGVVFHENAGPTSTYTISGAASYLLIAGGGSIYYPGSISWSISTPITVTATASAYRLGLIYCYGNTFTGSAVTGKRYDATLNGVIATEGGGASYFPGTVAGTTATGGQYA